MKNFDSEKVKRHVWWSILIIVTVFAILFTAVFLIHLREDTPPEPANPDASDSPSEESQNGNDSPSEGSLEEYYPFSVEYVGYALSNPINKNGASAVIAFQGEKNGRGVFKGDVTVSVNDEKVYECLDFEFWGEDGNFSLITDDGWTPDLGVPRDTRMVGSIRVDGDMESFLLIPSESNETYVAFVAPAQTHSEAYDLYFELYGTEKP